MYNLKRKVNMKLKLQFWRSDKVVAVSVLECEGVPVTTDRENAIEVCSYHITKLFVDSEMILNNHETGKISTIEVDNPREYIDKLVNNVTRELFTPEKREVKVGDTVTLYGDNNTYYKVLDILPEKYYNRYIIATTDYSEYDKPVVYAQPTVTPVDKKLTFTKEFIDNLETYTWEM